MARIVVLGAGICGLAAGLMLRRDGHDVTVLERDASPEPDSPDEAWDRWERGGVAQFRQAHYLQPLGHAVLEQELPDVRDALLAAGAGPFTPLSLMPPSIEDRAPRPGDERFETVATRRPTFEYVVARAAAAELDVRRGTAVAALLVSTSHRIPHVEGVRTDTGEELRADLVVDAMGRRSRVCEWLAEAGTEAPFEESEDSGFLYYTRFFHGTQPDRWPALLMPIGTISVLTLPGDNDTWSLTLYTASGDQPLKRLRDPDVWSAVLAACPLHAPLLEGEPITGVLPMGGVVDRIRRLAPDGRPVATGIALVADAWACTNPSVGRGIALGLRHAQLLRDTVREELDDPLGFAEAWDATTEAELSPWYRATVALDRDRLREMHALRDGLPRPEPADRAAAVRAAFVPAAMGDPDVFRAMMAERSCLGPPSPLDDPELAERVLELASGATPSPPSGPDRAQLLALVA